jgi:hypothetical protein
MGACSKCRRFGLYASTCNKRRRKTADKSQAPMSTSSSLDEPPSSLIIPQSSHDAEMQSSMATNALLHTNSYYDNAEVRETKYMSIEEYTKHREDITKMNMEPLVAPLFASCTTHLHVTCGECHVKIRGSTRACPKCRDPISRKIMRHIELGETSCHVLDADKWFHALWMESSLIPNSCNNRLVLTLTAIYTPGLGGFLPRPPELGYGPGRHRRGGEAGLAPGTLWTTFPHLLHRCGVGRSGTAPPRTRSEDGISAHLVPHGRDTSLALMLVTGPPRPIEPLPISGDAGDHPPRPNSGGAYAGHLSPSGGGFSYLFLYCCLGLLYACVRDMFGETCLVCTWARHVAITNVVRIVHTFVDFYSI